MNIETIKALESERVSLVNQRGVIDLQIDAIDSLLKFQSKQKIEQLPVTLSNDEYPITKSITTKVVYTLSKIGQGTVPEIVEYILNHDESVNKNTIKTNVTLASSGLSRKENNNIQVIGKDGRANIYGYIE